MVCQTRYGGEGQEGHTDLVKRVLDDGLNEVGRRVEGTHHGVFDVEVDAGLLWVDADLDGIVYCPVEGERELCGEWECTNYRLTGTRMLSKRTAEGLIVVRSMSELGRTAEQSPMPRDFVYYACRTTYSTNEPGFFVCHQV